MFLFTSGIHGQVQLSLNEKISKNKVDQTHKVQCFKITRSKTSYILETHLFKRKPHKS